MKIVFSIALPPNLLEKIENERGLVPRSRFVQSILEKYFEEKQGEKDGSIRNN